VYERARRLAQRLAHVDPLVRHTARRAHLELATTDETAERIRALGAPSVEVACAVALSDETMAWLGRLPLPPSEGPVRFVSVGRMLHWKGFALGIEGFARAVRAAARDGDPSLDGATFTLYGDGPERRRLLALARRLGVEGRVHLPGQVPREHLAEVLAGARALVHPSLHDSGGYATLEAAAAGRPVVCLGLGGPARQVAHGRTGYVVAALTPEQAVEGLAQALRALAADPGRARAMGAAGREAVGARFRWALQAERALVLYRRLLAGPAGDGLATDLPALGVPAARADALIVPVAP
jgi:glycosyltransferase involved in cell wall biosynthesis